MESLKRRTGPAAWLDAVDRDGVALGAQMAVSVVSALFLALLLRLEYPSWAVFTVLMLSMARYVGAVQEKSILRLIGTVVGGCLGFLATGALQQTPSLYLPLTFLVVAVSVSMFGQSRAPYAFFLVGLTYMVISADSQGDPSTASRYALYRVVEVGLGVMVSMVVQVLVFPRYANTDFSRLIGSAFGELAQAAARGAESFSTGGSAAGGALRDFPAKSSRLRVLMRFGAMESRRFRQHIGRHAAMVDFVSRAAALVRSTGRHEPAPEPYRSALAEEVSGIWELIGEGFETLSRGGSPGAAWNSRLAALQAAVEAKLLALRANPASGRIEAFESGDLSGHLLALEELGGVVRGVDALVSDPAKKVSLRESLALAPAWPDRPWIHRGIRAGLAAVAALVLEDWLSPPGGPMMVLCAYTFSSLNSMSPSEAGDRGVVRDTLALAAVVAGLSLLLLAATPAMAAYSVLNIVIGAWAFLFGYWFHRAGGVTVPLTFSFMLLVCVVALNAQRPVDFQGVVGFFFGILNGAVISMVAQRLVWPVLPQKNLVSGAKKYLETLRDALPGGLEGLPLWRRMEHALFPAKARTQIEKMAGPTCPPGEARKLEEFVLTLQELSRELHLCAGRLSPILPPAYSEKGNTAIARAKEAFRNGLGDLASALDGGRPSADPVSRTESAIADWERWMEWLRAEIREQRTPPSLAVPLLGFSSRYRLTLVLLRRAQLEARDLRPEEYFGDVAL